MSAKYQGHHFDLGMMADQSKMEQLLNFLDDETVTIRSNITWLQSPTLVVFYVTMERWAEGKVVDKNQMSSDCRPYAVVIQNRFSIMGIKF